MGQHGNAILALIPTRGGSRGLSKKNLRPVLGRPLIAYTIAAARGCSAVSEVVVSTDDDEIEETAQLNGAEVYRHPPELSIDGRPTFPVIEHVVRDFCSRGRNYRFIAVLRATSPLRTAADITKAIDFFTCQGRGECGGHPVMWPCDTGGGPGLCGKNFWNDGCTCYPITVVPPPR